jgi:hypothetical protein
MKIYISYSWKQPAKSIVTNWLCPCLKQSNIDYYIDEKDCRYGHDIEAFEREIGQADNVLVVLSNSYFYSLNCMYELALIIKNGIVSNRVRLVNLEDFSRTSDMYRKVYDNWCYNALQLQQNLSNDEYRDRPLLNELEKVNTILTHFDKAWEYIQKINTLSFEQLSANQFQKLIAHIKDELLLDADINTEINTDVPIKVKQPEPSIYITQTGAQSVSQIINDGGISVINF